jgi:hypothetical protein
MNRRLLILLTTVLCFSCSTSIYDAKGVPKGNPCAHSVPHTNSNRPIMCVDDRDLAKLTTSPNAAWARRNAPIRWYTVTGGGGLSIAFSDENCVKASGLSCSGGSSCAATLNGGGSQGNQCKYSGTITRPEGTKTEDPIIIIDGGVYDPGEPPPSN